MTLVSPKTAKFSENEDCLAATKGPRARNIGSGYHFNSTAKTNNITEGRTTGKPDQLCPYIMTCIVTERVKYHESEDTLA